MLRAIKNMHNDKNIQHLATAMLSSYFDFPVTPNPAAKGNANANFIVTTNEQNYFFRIYLPIKDFERNKEDLVKEIEVINWFGAKGFPVAKALPTKSGQQFVFVDKQFGALFEYLEGSHAYGHLTQKHFAEVGRLMGRIHKETAKEQLRCDKKWPDGNFWNRIFRKIEENKSLVNENDLKSYHHIQDQLQMLEKVPQYLIHGDYHFANMLFNDDDELTGLLDFDDYRMGHFVDDIIRSFICELIYTPKEEYQLKAEFVNAFWDAYTNERSLSADELALIPLYKDLHYLSGVISLRKKDQDKAEELERRVGEFREMMKKVIKL